MRLRRFRGVDDSVNVWAQVMNRNFAAGSGVNLLCDFWTRISCATFVAGDGGLRDANHLAESGLA